MRILFSFLLICSAICSSAQGKVRNVDAATFKKMVDEKKYTLIDLRTDDEIARKGMIKGAVQIDYLGKDVDKKLGALDKSKTYLIYCASGGRSGDCAAQMNTMGFKDVVNLDKGFENWRAKGFEVEKK